MKGRFVVGAAFTAFSTLACHGVQAAPYLSTMLTSVPEFNPGFGNGVSLYGSVDMGVNYQDDNGHSVLQTQSGGEWTSKIGFFGREDLGGGMHAEFNLESGFLANSGQMQSTTSFFNRESWVGLSSDTYGKVRLGEQMGTGLPIFVDVFGVVGTNSVYTWLGEGVVQTPRGYGFNADLGPGASQMPARVNNAITYTSPSYAGVSTELMYAPSDVTGQSPTAAVQGGLLQWYNGTTYLAATYNQVWGQNGTSTVRNDLYGLGAVYDTGKIVLSTSFSQFAPKLAGDGIARVYSLGAILPIGRNAFEASVVYRGTSGVRDTANNPAKDSALGVMLGYDYKLSTRTGLYARAGFIKNYGISTILLNNNLLPMQPGSTAPDLGTTPVTVSIGMYHNF